MFLRFRYSAFLMLASCLLLSFTCTALPHTQLPSERVRLLVALDISRSTDLAYLDNAAGLLRLVPAELWRKTPDAFEVIAFAGGDDHTGRGIWRLFPSDQVQTPDSALSSLRAIYHNAVGRFRLDCPVPGTVAPFTWNGQSGDLCRSDFGKLFAAVIDFVSRSPDGDIAAVERTRNVIWIVSDGISDPDGLPVVGDEISFDPLLSPAVRHKVIDLILIQLPSRNRADVARVSRAWYERATKFDGLTPLLNVTIEPVAQLPEPAWTRIRPELINRILIGYQDRLVVDDVSCRLVGGPGARTLDVLTYWSLTSSYSQPITPSYDAWYVSPHGEVVRLCGSYADHFAGSTFPSIITMGTRRYAVQGCSSVDFGGVSPTEIHVQYQVPREESSMRFWQERSFPTTVPCAGAAKPLAVLRELRGVSFFSPPSKHAPYQFVLDGLSPGEGFTAPVSGEMRFMRGIHSRDFAASCEPQGPDDLSAQELSVGSGRAKIISGRSRCKVWLREEEGAVAALMPHLYKNPVIVLHSYGEVPVDVVTESPQRTLEPVSGWSFLHFGPILVLLIAAHALFWPCLLLWRSLVYLARRWPDGSQLIAATCGPSISKLSDIWFAGGIAGLIGLGLLRTQFYIPAFECDSRLRDFAGWYTGLVLVAGGIFFFIPSDGHRRVSAGVTMGAFMLMMYLGAPKTLFFAAPLLLFKDEDVARRLKLLKIVELLSHLRWTRGN